MTNALRNHPGQDHHWPPKCIFGCDQKEKSSILIGATTEKRSICLKDDAYELKRPKL